MAIDIGHAAEDGNSTAGLTFARLDKNNPANDTGTLDTVEIWANTNLTNCKVGTLYSAGGNDYTCRDVHVIGSVTAGSKQTFSGITGFNVTSGDLMGIYATGGVLEGNDAGGIGAWYYAGDSINAAQTETYTTWKANGWYAVYGTGSVAAAGAARGWAQK